MANLLTPEEVVLSFKPGLISGLCMQEAIYKDRSLIIARLEELRKGWCKECFRECCIDYDKIGSLIDELRGGQ